MKTTGGASPVYIAAEKACDESLKVLLDEKANLNEPANDGATPLIIATQNGHQSSVSLLLHMRADVNKALMNGVPGATALYVAAQNGYLQIAKVLVAFGADVQKCSETGTSPLFIALQTGHINMFLQVLEELKMKPGFPEAQRADSSLIRNVALGAFAKRSCLGKITSFESPCSACTMQTSALLSLVAGHQPSEGRRCNGLVLGCPKRAREGGLPSHRAASACLGSLEDTRRGLQVPVP